MSENSVTTADTTASRGIRPSTLVVAAGFGVIYAYYLWDAIRSLVVLPELYDSIGVGRETAPWTLLIAGVIVPPVVYLLALVVGRRHTLGGKALILLAGLGLLACMSLGLIALA